MIMILKRLPLAVGLVAAISTTSCNARTCNTNFFDARQTIEASATMATRTVAVGSFHEIKASRVKVVYTQGPLSQARIEAPDNVLEHVNVSVSGGTLTAEIDRDYNVEFRSGRGVTVTVSAPDIEEALALLAGSVEIASLNVRRNLELGVTTSGSITIGTLSASGKVEADATTAGSITITALTANEFNAEATTSATVSVAGATVDEAEIDVSTGATVTIAGTAAEVELDATTGGTVNATALEAQRGSAEAGTGGNVRCNIASPSSLRSSTGGSVSNGR